MDSDSGNKLLGIPPTLIRTIKQGLQRAAGDQAADVLQEAGFASGEELYHAFRSWLATRTDLGRPEDLDSGLLGEMLSSFFADLGWGTVTVERLSPAALSVSSENWAEPEATGESDVPACYITTGFLAALLGKLAQDVVAVMEVECRSRGDKSCRFLVGSPTTLQTVFEGMSRGSDYRSVLTTA